MKKEPQIDYSRIYVKPKSQEEIEHERMMDNLLLEFLDDDDQDESETIRSKALSSISSSSNRCYGNRTLGDISIEEGDEIVKDICENGLELEAIWEKYKFKPNTIMCDFPNAWKRMRKIRVCEREGKEVNWDELFAEDPDDDENDIWGDNAEKPESLRIIEERKREQEREEEELWS